jgi:hypothetical protein
MKMLGMVTPESFLELESLKTKPEMASYPHRRNELAAPLSQGFMALPEFASQRFPSAGDASQLCWPDPSISL